MNAFLAIVRVSVRQLAGRGRLVGFGLLSLLPAGLLAAVAATRPPAGLDTRLGVLLVTPFFSLVIPIVSLVLAGSALGDERRDKTLSFLVLRPIPRFHVAAGKTAAAWVVSMGFAFAGALGLTLTWVALGGSFAVLPPIAVGAALACLMYSAVFTLLGNLVARSTLVGLLYVLFGELIMAGELPRLASLSLWRIGFGATLDLMPEGFPARALLGAVGDWVPSVENALIVAGSLCVLVLVALTVLLRRTDSI